MPSDAHSAAEREERADGDEAGARGPRCGGARRRAPREREPRRADEEQQREPDHACVREHLDVEVLDAPLAPFGREREVVDVREARARVVDVRLEHLRPRRALPADADDRVVLCDPQPDVGEHRALRVRLDADRRLVAADAEEAQEVLERVSAHGRHAAGDDRDDRDERERLSSARPEAPTRRDPERDDAEREPSGRGDRPGEDRARGRRRRARRRRATARVSRAVRATIAAAASARLIAASAARSWCPRNEGCRQPAFHAPKMSTPKNWSSATPTATAAQSTIPPSTIVRSLGAPHEERHGDGEEPVLDELEEAHEMVVEERVVERDRAEGLEREPREERGSRDPERAGGAEPRDSPRATPRRRQRRGRRRRRDPRAGRRPSSSRGRRRARAGSARGRTGTGSTAASTSAPSASRSTRLRRPDDERVLSNAPVVTAPL